MQVMGKSNVFGVTVKGKCILLMQNICALTAYFLLLVRLWVTFKRSFQLEEYIHNNGQALLSCILYYPDWEFYLWKIRAIFPEESHLQQFMLRTLKATPKSRHILAWKWRRRRKAIFFPIYWHCMIEPSIIKQEKYFFSPSNWSWGHSHVGPLFTTEEQKR